MLWDKYYQAIADKLEEACVIKQTELQVTDKEKKYYEIMKQDMRSHKNRGTKSFYEIKKLLDRQKRAERAKENAINTFIDLKRDTFRNEYGEFRERYDKFTKEERLAQKLWYSGVKKINLFEAMDQKKYRVRKGKPVNFMKLMNREEKALKLKEYEKTMRAQRLFRKV